MIIYNTSNDGWVSGIQKTFDGKHPCAMCRQIAKEKARETAPDPIRDLLGKDVSVKHFILSPVLPEHRVFVCDIATKTPLPPPHHDGLGAEPPVLPPPRLLV
jgi:hypothetical protein